MTEILAAQDTSIGPAGGRKNADVTAWVAVAAGALGAMLATLDISIVNSALPVIQGEIGATGAEGTWIATSFLVAEIVVIPLSAWLERLFGLRTLLIIADCNRPYDHDHRPNGSGIHGRSPHSDRNDYCG